MENEQENPVLVNAYRQESTMKIIEYFSADDIQPTDLPPWIGWVYTFPYYRGNRYVGKLLRHAEALAEEAGIKNIYISTNHEGLYEKYGYEFFGMMKDMHGEASAVYVRDCKFRRGTVQ